MRSQFAALRFSFLLHAERTPLESLPHRSVFVSLLLMRFMTFSHHLKRRILKDGLRENEARDEAFRRMICSIPKGKVSTYGRVAEAAGYPLYHRAVAQLLRRETLTALPWQRVVGAGGEIRLKGEFADEQISRLRREGVRFETKRVNMKRFEHTLRSWDAFDNC